MDNYYGGNNVQMNGYGGQNGRMANPILSVVAINDPQSIEWYPVPPNNTVFLMDFNARKFYIKAKNSMGIQEPLRIFEFNEVVAQMPQSYQQQPVANQNTVTREEFEAQAKTLNELKQMLEDLTAPSK